MNSKPRKSFNSAEKSSEELRRHSQPDSQNGIPNSRPNRLSQPSIPEKGESISLPNTASNNHKHDDKSVTERNHKTSHSKEVADRASIDPEYFNPDGSLRTCYKMPSFQAAYAEARKARYIRHKKLLDTEKELTVKQIFNSSP